MSASLVEQTYDALLNLIVEEQLTPGDRLPSEMQLCERFAVSRNTIRTALNKLQVLGLAETRQGGGTYVREVGNELYLNFFVPALLSGNADLIEIIRFRRGIEIESARLAAINATEEDIDRIRYAQSKCTENGLNMPAFAASNNDFHYAIAQASGSRLFMRMMSIIKGMITPVMRDYLDAQGGADIDSNYYHTLILEGISRHKPEEASYFMDRHMTMLLERVTRYVEDKTTREQQFHATKGGKTV